MHLTANRRNVGLLEAAKEQYSRETGVVPRKTWGVQRVRKPDRANSASYKFMQRGQSHLDEVFIGVYGGLQRSPVTSPARADPSARETSAREHANRRSP